MKKSKTTKKKVGRPPTGADPLISTRIDADALNAVDVYANQRSITRSDALRELIRTGIRLSIFPGKPLVTEVEIFRGEPVVRVRGLERTEQYVLSQRDEAISRAEDAGNEDLALLLRERFRQAKKLGNL